MVNEVAHIMKGPGIFCGHKRARWLEPFGVAHTVNMQLFGPPIASREIALEQDGIDA